MEIDELKSTWKKIEPAAKSDTEISAMLKSNSHPVLKGIRRQLTIEAIGFSVFLLCYYTMFDGAEKPAWANAVLIVSILVPLLHNFWGYFLNGNLIRGRNIAVSLRVFITKLKVYITFAIISRLLFISGLAVFFGNSIQFTPFRTACLVAVVLVFAGQLFLLYRIWGKRVKTLSQTLNEIVRGE